MRIIKLIIKNDINKNGENVQKGDDKHDAYYDLDKRNMVKVKDSNNETD